MIRVGESAYETRSEAWAHAERLNNCQTNVPVDNPSPYGVLLTPLMLPAGTRYRRAMGDGRYCVRGRECGQETEPQKPRWMRGHSY